MYQGFVLSESLKNPLVLNELEKIYVKVEHHPEYEGEAKIWHDFKVRIKEDDLERVADLLASEMKDAWYAHFWNEETVWVILPQKVFKMPKEPHKWQSGEYQECKAYAIANGVEERYLDFWIDE